MNFQKDITNYYNNLAKDYDINRFSNTYGSYIDKQERTFLENHWSLLNAETIDIACGTGRHTFLAKYGCDISPKMLDIAKKKYPNKEFFLCNANKLPFKEKMLDGAISFHFIMHLDEKALKLILNEVNRVLKKDGVFIFDFPSHKRRKLFNRKREGWHGSNALSISDLKILIDKNWDIKFYQGILFFPIHRFPKFLRSYILFFDDFLCRSWLKEYASYMVIKLVKND